MEEAVKTLKAGGVIIFPTDTVWGLGVAADNPVAVKKFYLIKRREANKPTAVLVADLEQAEKLGQFSEKTRQLATKYWPGALTIVVKGRREKTIGLRVPDFPLVQELCRRLGSGIMAGSANYTGKLAPLKRGEISRKLSSQVDLVMAGECGGGLASTVVDTTVKPWKLLRQGPIQI